MLLINVIMFLVDFIILSNLIMKLYYLIPILSFVIYLYIGLKNIMISYIICFINIIHRYYSVIMV